jgi:glycolate oxidase subunit GlcD
MSPSGTATTTFRELVKIVGAAHVLTDAADLLVYESDGLTHYRQRPRAIVLPGSTAEVAAVVKWCHATGTPYVPRGAGTGLSGGALPCGTGIVIETARMRSILEVNARDRFARVQCGVINAELSVAVKPLGLHYAPDPSSQTACTLGGNVAENSGGPHTMKYGTTTDHVLGLTVVTADGEVVELGGTRLDEPGLDLVGTFVASEGTFGIATELTVRLTPSPAVVRTFLFAFRALDDACRMVRRIVSDGILPAALEMLDQKTIEVVEDSVLAAGYPRDADAVLLVELDGLAAQVDADAALVRTLGGEFGVFETREATSPEERTKLWKGRKGAFGALGRLSPDLYVQDVVVPRSKLPEMLKRVREIATKHRVLLSNVFHAGDGNLHPNISYDGRDADEVKRVVAAGEEIIAACLELGGSLSGEHGIGVEKRDAMALQFTPDDLDVFSRVRRAFNPLGLCNPDKVLPGPKVCIEFRPGVVVEGVTHPVNGTSR